jgi:hypothetical protein
MPIRTPDKAIAAMPDAYAAMPRGRSVSSSAPCT